MNILVDENIPNLTVSTLRSRGDDVLDIRVTPQQGLFDDALWAIAREGQRVLITQTKDLRITAMTIISEFSSFGYANRTRNEFTLRSWRRCATFRHKPNREVCSS